MLCTVGFERKCVFLWMDSSSENTVRFEVMCQESVQTEISIINSRSFYVVTCKTRKKKWHLLKRSRRNWFYFQWPPTESVSFLQVSSTGAIAHTAVRQRGKDSLHQLWMTASRQLTPMPAPRARAKPCREKKFTTLWRVLTFAFSLFFCLSWAC